MKKLVTCFSATGTTEKKAGELAEVIHADFSPIVPEVKYEPEDLDWRNPASRACQENNNPDARPAIRPDACHPEDYDVIYIGFPIWWGLAPRIINTYLESHDFKGRTVVIFATSGGSGIDYAVRALKKTYPDLDIASSAILKGPVTEDIL